jgi:hypothetical protein
MEQTLKIKQWHLPDFTVTIRDENNNPLNLNDYDWVEFVMVDWNWNVVVHWSWDFVDKENWVITYRFQEWDTNIPWSFKAYFSLKKWDVRKISVPTDYFRIEIIKWYLTS